MEQLVSSSITPVPIFESRTNPISLFACVYVDKIETIYVCGKALEWVFWGKIVGLVWLAGVLHCCWWQCEWTSTHNTVCLLKIPPEKIQLRARSTPSLHTVWTGFNPYLYSGRSSSAYSALVERSITTLPTEWSWVGWGGPHIWE